MVKKTIHKLSILFSILKIYKYSALFLFFLILASSFSESLGLGMILPLLEVITSPGDATPSVKYLAPILQHFPHQYRLLIISMMFVGFILTKNILFVLRTGFSVNFVYRFRKLWANSIMEKYMHAEYSYLLSFRQGVLINNLIIEPSRAAKLLQHFIEFFSKLILCLFLYGLLLFANWKITLIITIVAGIVMMITRKLTYEYSLGIGQKRLALSQKLMAQGSENISAIRMIKSFSLEEKKRKEFASNLSSFLSILLRFTIIRNLPKPVAESLVVIGVVTGLIYLNYVSKTPLPQIIPIVGLFIVISQRLFPVLAQLFSDRMNILALIPSLKLMHKIYLSRVDREELDTGSVLTNLTEDIVFSDVHFSYDTSKNVFEGLNLTIPKGKTTAIVGPSGSGKSTLVDMIFRLFRPQKGTIRIGEIDLNEINLRSWRRMIGYVSQDVYLFNTTVRENILVGKPDATENDIFEAAKKANADAFIRKLPQGYDTIVGERGLAISGGQRQRIAIARALIRDPEILIFDEATSAVDLESERLIQKSINDLAKQKTMIIISHHLSSMENADVFYVLDNGRIVEAGDLERLKSIRYNLDRLSSSCKKNKGKV